MISIIKKLVCVFLYYSGIIYFIRYSNNKIYHNPINVLFLHGIINREDELYSLMKRIDYLTVEEFEKRIKYLQQHYKFIALDEAVGHLRKGICPPNCIALTFDDGYKCVYRSAFPILVKYKIPFTVFITTGAVEKKELLWYDKLLFMIGKTQVQEFSLPEISKEIYHISSDNEKKEAFTDIVRFLKRVNNEEMEKHLRNIRDILKIKEKELEEIDFMLSWDEIKEMHDSGLVSYGAHTINHPILTEVALNVAKHEIQESKRIIEEKLGITVNSFAYPNGDYNTKIENIVITSGYKYAFTVIGPKKGEEFSAYTLGRVGFTYEFFSFFALRVAGLFDLFHKVGDLIRHSQYWLPKYCILRIKDNLKLPSARKLQQHVYLSICDHFEPLVGGKSYEEGLKKVKYWVEQYPAIANKHKDSDGGIPKYTFFFPIEEYEEKYLEMLSDLCQQGYGEVEIHLHHDSDTPDNLRKQLIDFKTRLADKHTLLSREPGTKEIKYGFIHGNWALDNSRPDGCWCGVDNEIQILQETGCYADFTMPSAPDITQTRTLNSIYYATDDPEKPKSHDLGQPAVKGKSQDGLLMVQGPLMLNWHSRKWGLFPKIENGQLGYDNEIDTDRIKLWLKANIHVKNAPEAIFIKLYTHGCQDNNIDYLLNEGLDNLYTKMEDLSDKLNLKLHYVSAREMVNTIKAIENNTEIYNRQTMKNEKLVKI
jgi:peptidoglycan/xylan/chitin deacetylase (PgdA/CDA1 family)